jgi:threonine/homoserine/homoserine lactone efflux protein
VLGIHDYWIFVTTGVILNLTPGQDTFYILGRSIAQGSRIGVASALGVCAGCLVHTFAAAVGLSAILATSASAFMVLKVAGAVYLVYLGVRMLLAAGFAAEPTSMARAQSALVAFRQGVLTNVLNPKVALFFLAFMPQFIDPTSQTKVAAFIALGITFIFTGTIWCLTLALSAAKLRDLIARRPSGMAAFSRAAGGLFVFLGLRLALSKQ